MANKTLLRTRKQRGPSELHVGWKKCNEYHEKILLFWFYYFYYFIFLPATRIFNGTAKGYECALIVFGSLFEYKSIFSYVFNIFVNLGNVLTILVFILQFKLDLKKLFPFQLLAFTSASYWAIDDIVRYQRFTNLYIGYWDWLFSLLFMAIVTISARKHIRYKDNNQTIHRSIEAKLINAGSLIVKETNKLNNNYGKC